jgi:Protein of unknown function (DUF3891)
MLRLETEIGWWLVTHPDHARLAGDFAAAWGNDAFASPEPRERVLFGIRTHDDGWAARDACPQITRHGKPSAFSVELVGKYSAFEEIDLRDYLEVRDRAVRLIADQDPYSGILVSMHTYNLLTERADRSTIRQDQLPLLDNFLEQQQRLQGEMMSAIEDDATLTETEKRATTIRDHFRLLQATDNLSLLSCVNYSQPATLLHPLRLRNGSAAEVQVTALGERHFHLEPWPFREVFLTLAFPARHVQGKLFDTAAQLQAAFDSAPVTTLTVTLSA